MYSYIKFDLASPFGKPITEKPAQSISDKESAGISKRVFEKHPLTSENAISPQIKFPLIYKVDVDKSSELYRQLSESIKAELPITVKSSNPIYSHWVAMYGIQFKPITECESEPVGRMTYLIDAITGNEILIDSLELPEAETLTNLQQEYQLYEEYGFADNLCVKVIEENGITYQVIDDSYTLLGDCPDLQIRFKNIA